MERVAEADEPRHRARLEQLFGHHAGDAPTHRFAADRQWALGLERRHRVPILALERLALGRRLALPVPASGHIGELEARDPHTFGVETRAQIVHPGAVHRGPRAMGKKQRGLGLRGAGQKEIGHAAIRRRRGPGVELLRGDQRAGTVEAVLEPMQLERSLGALTTWLRPFCLAL